MPEIRMLFHKKSSTCPHATRLCNKPRDGSVSACEIEASSAAAGWEPEAEAG